MTANSTNGDLRLVGGLSQYEGRVEVCWSETWSTVCNDFWSSDDARVMCRQLGYLSQLGSKSLTQCPAGGLAVLWSLTVKVHCHCLIVPLASQQYLAQLENQE